METLARLANLPGALPGACAQGLIWGIMAIGVYLTYRILDVADRIIVLADGKVAAQGSKNHVLPELLGGKCKFCCGQECVNDHE